MRGPKGIKHRLRAFGEPAQTIFHPQGTNTIPTPCQDLMRITLMADVPDQLVLGRVKHRMQRDGQLNNAKPCAQMPTCLRHG